MKTYTLGLDFGTDSVRAVLVDTDTGTEQAAAVFHYPRWAKGLYCHAPSNRYRQHPLDHLEGMEATVRSVMEQSGVPKASVKGLCVDTTGSSPLPVTREGTPLALTETFSENPNAMVVLWKDHTALAEAEAINNLARVWDGPDFTQFVGGIYSSEWFWAKIMHITATDPDVGEAAWSWMEHCDLMTYLLVGGGDLQSFKHSRCAAGHKAMWHESWGGLPSKAFLDALHPGLGSLRDRLYTHSHTSDESAGGLCPEWAGRLGLNPGIAVAVGTFDAHAGAVGAGIGPHALVRVMGTSTCDIMVSDAPELATKAVRGICGQVNGSVIPGKIGLEAGQSAFGDLLAWFGGVVAWPLEHLVYNHPVLDESQRLALREDLEHNLLEELSRAAEAIPLEEAIPIALDWINGRRSPDAHQGLQSAMACLSLGSSAPHIFLALVHAICFGSKKIVDRFEEEGVRIDQVIGIGGVARKSSLIMQTLADVLDRPIRVAASDHAPALGAAIYAAVAAGIYPDVGTAAARMGSPIEKQYSPRPKAAATLKDRMKHYEQLGALAASLTQNS
ncbi:ribulokinase [Robiginitalea sediminis]|uniref:ribulokinase n=1 Tax=Robiginitalea sediminis TaxID=1982593 RepID=UPI000B4A9885|nr:ribulokinase [Robiginitalea sediminis]